MASRSGRQKYVDKDNLGGVLAPAIVYFASDEWLGFVAGKRMNRPGFRTVAHLDNKGSSSSTVWYILICSVLIVSLDITQ